MSLTEKIARLKAKRTALREQVAELEAHGGPHTPISILGEPRTYDRLPDAQLKSRLADLRAEIAETDVEIAEAEAAREKKLLGTARPSERGSAQEPAEGKIAHSKGYCWFHLEGEDFHLTKTQAAVLRVLDQERLAGRPWVEEGWLMVEIKSQSSRLRDIFRSRPEAYEALIEKKGNLVRLKV